MGAYQGFLVIHNYQFGVGELVNCRGPAYFCSGAFKAGKCKGVCARALLKDYLYSYSAVVGGNQCIYDFF